MPTKITDIAASIETYAPLSLQESYDNSGLQIGDPGKAVTKILVCLSLTEDILQEAISKQCQLVVTHHPLLFKGLKRITPFTPEERMVITALAHGIAIYSAHTNLDITSGGVSTELALQLGMKNITPLLSKASDTGLGIIGEMPRPVPALEFLRMVKNTLRVKAVRYAAHAPAIVINKVAICGGSGASMIKDAISAGADAYVSGDFKYHDFDTYGTYLLLTDVGHFESELIARNLLARIIKENFPEVTVMISESETNPIEIL